jgi:hypothetical protein
MNQRKRIVIPGAAVVLLLSGCVSKDLVFVTKTSMGIDVDGTPQAVSFAYDRVEGFVGPRYKDGTVPPVIGTIETDGAFPDRQVRQKFAIGRAAVLVAGGTASELTPDPNDETATTMYFGTATTLGLKFGLDSAGTTVGSAVLGYKRKELSVVPVTGRTFPSVFATIGADTKPAAGANAKFGVTQFFATGAAADAIAPNFKQEFATQATQALASGADESAQQNGALQVSRQP